MNIYELIGIIIGDGHILYNKNNRGYRLEITGNAKEDLNYFEQIASIIKEKSKNNVKIKVKKEKKGMSLRLYINDKEFVEYLINELKLPYGNKTFTIKIPNKFLDWKYSKYIIRGICETDGCIYFSRSKVIKFPSYPRIEIRSSSNELISQLITILKERGFKVQLLRPNKTAKVYVSGSIMLNKWIKEIGFTHEKNLSKIRIWKKLGYYIPRTTHKQRLRMLNNKI